MRTTVAQTILLSGTLVLIGSMAQAFAQSTAGGMSVPLNYNNFQPPPRGGSYVDPVFGSTVKRISNAPGTLDNDIGGNLTWISSEYSTMSPFNSDNSNLLLVHQSYFGLYDGNVSYIWDLPLEINAVSEPRWSKRDNRTIYYVHLNQLKTYDIYSGAMTIVRTFGEYSKIYGMGESDISMDGDHFVFSGDGRYIFVYTISRDAKSSTFDTGGRGFDSLYITPYNNVTITWDQVDAGRYSGIELFDSDMNFLRQVARAGGHMDVTLDTDGRELLVWINARDPRPVCNNAIVKIRLADGQQTCLASFDWSLALHISAPDNSGFVYAETYAPANPAPSSGWAPYANELLRVMLDGSQVLRLAHHRSRQFQTNVYNWQPRISTSRDGSRVVYNSDYNLQALDGYGDQYIDAYLIVVGNSAAAAPTPAAPPAPVPTRPVTATTAVSYANNDPSVLLTGTWFPNDGGSSVLAMNQGSQATFTFTGTGAQWIGSSDPWSGIARVYLDGALQATVDTYSANTKSQAALYSLSGLGNTAHTLTIQVTGMRNANSAGAWVWVGSFRASIPSTATAPAPAPVSPTSANVVRYEESDPAVRLTGTWLPNNAASDSGGSAVLAMDPGSQAKFTFTGTSVQWIGVRDPWSGIAQVYLDGALQATVDTYSANTQSQAALYSLGGLGNAAHNLTIVGTGTRNANSGGAWVWVDAFDVSSPSIATTTLSPTPKRIEQEAPSVVYTGGAWSTHTAASESNGSAVLSMDANARATLTFTGTGVTWIGYRDEWSGRALVYVDGELRGSVDTYASPSQARAVLFTATGLSSGVHSLAIEVAGTHDASSGGSWVWVDAFDIAP